MPQPEPQLTDELDRIKEDYWTYSQYIPEQYCQMCDSSENIVPNDELESKEKYPWFCTECEDASEVINLRQMLVAEIESELASAVEKERDFDEVASEKALKNFRRLRLIDYIPLMDEAPPAETIISVLKRGLGGQFSDEAIKYIFEKAVRYYLKALTPPRESHD